MQEAAAEAAGTNGFAPNELEQVDEVAYPRELNFIFYLLKNFCASKLKFMRITNANTACRLVVCRLLKSRSMSMTNLRNYSTSL